MTPEQTTTEELKTLQATIAYLINEEGQDRTYLLEMVDRMLYDIRMAQFESLEVYVRRYCNIVDSPTDIRDIVNGINALRAQEENN